MHTYYCYHYLLFLLLINCIAGLQGFVMEDMINLKYIGMILKNIKTNLESIPTLISHGSDALSLFTSFKTESITASGSQVPALTSSVIILCHDL